MPTPGYHNTYLRVDLTDRNGRFVAIDDDTLRNYIGGSGLGVFLLLREDAADFHPLDERASVAFVFSPLVGSPLTTSAKFAVVSKSPLTNRINDSLASSRFAIAGKKSGCDALVITGRAREPSILVVDDGRVTLRSADGLWGLQCEATEREIYKQLGSEYSVAVIGPAGEKLVRYATVSHDGRHAGRGGTGAVLGSKNLKAIAIRGSQQVEWHDSEQLNRLAKDLSKRSFGPATAKYRELGTATNVLLFNRLNTLPTRNFQAGQFEAAEQISPEVMRQERQKTRAYCAACTIGCEHIYAMQPDKANDKTDTNSGGVRLEYENLFALGSLCGVGESQAVLNASKRCDELGLDSISTGGTIAFAMECVQRGILDEPWLTFGDGDALLKAIQMIGVRDGLGDDLAEGSRRFADKIGQGAIRFAPQVKGMEIPGYEPRTLQNMALGFAVGTRGADHNRSSAYEVDFSEQFDRRSATAASIAAAIEAENKAAVMDALILCKFLRGVFDDFFTEAATMLQAVTGWSVDSKELREVSRRIVNAKKQFNISAGWQPGEDSLPDRFVNEAMPNDESNHTLTSQRLRELIQVYNQQRGWTLEGWLNKTDVDANGVNR